MVERRRELEDAVGDVSFTPGRKDFAALLELLEGDEERAGKVERAMLRSDGAGVRYAMEACEAAAMVERTALRARIVRLVGREASERPKDTLLEFLLKHAADAAPKVRRSAARALGKLRTPEWAARIEGGLVAAWELEEGAPERRAIVASLGKVGGARSRALLDGLKSDDPELTRLIDEARLLLGRRSSRGAATHAGHGDGDEAAGASYAGDIGDSAKIGALDGKRVLVERLPIALHCRRGIERFLVEECPKDWGARVVGPGEVSASYAGRLDGIFRCRTFIDFGFVLDDEPVGADGREAAIARALCSSRTRAVVNALSKDPPRYRLAFADGAPHRAEVLRVAQAVAEKWPELVNDPSLRSLDFIVHELEGRVRLELAPRLGDERFAYRLADVPAASHPTLAAALVRVAGVRAGDRVWDPFAGSGTELIERARAGSYQELVGTDTDEKALQAARKNMEAAGVRNARLIREDALSFPAHLPSLVLTNPPMGRRVMRHEDIGEFCDRFIDRVASLLVDGGRLCWISPLPERTAERAAKAGLARELLQSVDMGGFDAEIQLLRR